MSHIQHKKTGGKCLICDEDINGKEFVHLHKTRRQTHNLCPECGENYLRTLLDSITANVRRNIRRGMQYVKCPGGYHGALRNRCQHKVDVNKIELPDSSSLASDLFRIKYVLASPLSFICPEQKCGQVIDVDPHYDNLRLTCRDCKTTWCRQCLAQPYHNRKTCVEFEVENKSSDNAQFIFDMAKKGLIKFCPRPQCKVPIFRSSGCNKIKCERCGLKWCWLCRETDIDYDHYNPASKSACANKLWNGTND